jgi:hypothetical protein
LEVDFILLQLKDFIFKDRNVLLDFQPKNILEKSSKISSNSSVSKQAKAYECARLREEERLLWAFRLCVCVCAG